MGNEQTTETFKSDVYEVLDSVKDRVQKMREGEIDQDLRGLISFIDILLAHSEKSSTVERLIHVKGYIENYYKAEDGAKTEMYSEGNATDVFNDGEDRGQAKTLYNIAKLIGMDVSEIHQQEEI